MTYTRARILYICMIYTYCSSRLTFSESIKGQFRHFITEMTRFARWSEPTTTAMSANTIYTIKAGPLPACLLEQSSAPYSSAEDRGAGHNMDAGAGSEADGAIRHQGTPSSLLVCGQMLGWSSRAHRNTWVIGKGVSSRACLHHQDRQEEELRGSA